MSWLEGGGFIQGKVGLEVGPEVGVEAACRTGAPRALDRLRVGIDHPKRLHDPLHPIKGAQVLLQGGQNIQSSSSCSFNSNLWSNLQTNLSLDESAPLQPGHMS